MALFLVAGVVGRAEATWSIVAVDPETREVGIAGASCIGGVGVIAGLAPGHGVVAAQALSSLAGRDRATDLLAQGASPSEVLAQLADPEADPRPWHGLGGAGSRQYAIASLDGPSQAAFTGERTYGWSGSVEAPGVVVAGNILVGPEVVERALAAFGAQPEGCAPTLADRLVAALWAGSEAGGDDRCEPQLSALSAFVAVAGPDDPAPAPGLQIEIPYEGINEVYLFPFRLLVRKGGDPERNPVRVLVLRYREVLAGSGARACLPATAPN